MVIALDFDGTITADPELMLSFAAHATQRGHKVYVVSARWQSNPPVLPRMLMPNGSEFKLEIICTEWKAKRKHLAKLGIQVDVWIDDMPEAVGLDHEQAQLAMGRQA